MKEIKLGKRELVATVDDEDYELVSRHKWYAKIDKKKKTIYVVSPNPAGRPRFIRMHRLIMGASSGEQVDHINGDGLCNIRRNLRVCNNSQNNANKGLTSANKSGYKGVYWYEAGRKWGAVIQTNNQNTFLGFFIDPVDAARAYNNAALSIFGEFARINQV